MTAPRRRDRTQRRQAAAVALSALAHAVLLLLLGKSLEPEHRPVSQPIEVSFVEIAPPIAAFRAPALEPAPTHHRAVTSPPAPRAPSQTADDATAPEVEVNAGAPARPTAAALPDDYLRLPRASASDTGPSLDLSPRLGLPDTGRGASASGTRDAGGRGLLVVQDDLRAPLRKTERKLVPRPGGGYLYRGREFDAELLPDGSVRFEHGAMPVELRGSGIGFDLNDLVLRALGEDPLFGAKVCFLDDVLQTRMALRRQHDHEARLRSLNNLRHQLDCVWSDEALGLAERREKLFKIWDDCREDEVGRQAQRIVTGFIRLFLPQGREQGYSEAEIAALNARRRTKRPFAPYQS